MLETLCGITFHITTDQQEFQTESGARLNYSAFNLPCDLQVIPNGLLFQDTVLKCEASIRWKNNAIELLLKGDGLDDTVFDLFAAAFYLLSRYEEYLTFTPDMHNRFEAVSSVLFKNQLLQRPLVNEWAAELARTFSKGHTQLLLQRQVFSCKLSIDVDQAFAFRHRGVLVNIAGTLKNAVQADMDFLKSRYQTFIKNAHDPYDTFNYLKRVQQELALPAIYFFNVGKQTTFDKNLPLTSQPFHNLVQQIHQYAEVGVHPSYYSDVHPEKVMSEKNALAAAIGSPVTQSRQHYLKLSLPQTFRRLLQAGITEDYTMGYATQAGFRAGTCTPFYWFDLERDEPTTLKIFPITYMEGTLFGAMGLSCNGALQTIKSLTDTVRFYNGCLVPLWHNHTVSDSFEWKGWRNVFEESLLYAVNT